jgi:hydrogenase maturation protease
MTATRANVLVLGLGNDLLGDDAVGLHVARAVRARLAGLPGCAVRETMEMGLALLDEIVGSEHLLLVDSIETGKAPPGHVHEFDADSLAGRRIGAPHFVGIVETLALGTALGLAMPRDVRVFAIEVKDAYTLSVTLSPGVQASVGAAADRICACAAGLSGSGFEVPRDPGGGAAAVPHGLDN